MEIVTKEYLENNIKAYDSYRGLGNKGKANGIATLDANGKLSNSQIPVLPETHLAVAGNDSAIDNAAVNSGPVYINTYDVKEGESPRHTGAISLEGKNGISVTAQTGGKIEISGHEKPPVLGDDNNKNSDTGNLVPKPTDTADKTFLRSDGSWIKPTNTKVSFTGIETENEDGDIILTSRNSSQGSTSTATVKKFIAGNNITLECDTSTGNLTINGPETGVALTNGTGIAIGTDNSINLQPATNNTIGGVKVGAFGTGEISQGTITVDGNSYTIYAPPANGKYYPVEINTDSGVGGHAVVKIPDVPSPFYEEGTSDNDKFTFAIEQYNVAYNWGAPIFAFTGDKGGSAFNDSLTAYNNLMNNNGGQAISSEDTEYITSSSFIGLTITCPSNVIFAQLDRPIYVPTNPGYTMNGSIISTIAEGKQQISIQNSNPAIGFPADSITVGNPGYASLKFATEGHTYNATVRITATTVKTKTVYTADIII